MTEPDPVVIERLLRRRLKFLAPQAPLPHDIPLRNLGLDSMEAVDLLLDIEMALGTTMPDEFLQAEVFATAGSLVAAVARVRGAA